MRSRSVIASLFVVTVVVYLQSIWFPLTGLDIGDYITDNPNVTSGISLNSIRWAFTSAYASNWHPLTWLSHMADCQLFGLDPVGHHLVNVLLHAINTALLLSLLFFLTGNFWSSALVAALFALHPLHVESVAWVAERKDVLSGLFWMLTLLCYALYQRRSRRCFYFLSLTAFALGLMAKPMLVTLPFVLLLLDFWPLARCKDGRALFSLIVEKAPFFVLSAASSIATLYAQQKGGSVASLMNLPFPARLANSLWAYWLYLRKTLWPSDLAAYYSITPLAPWQVASAAAFLGMVTLAAIWQARRRPYLIVGWLWYLGTLVPVIGLVKVGDQLIADRYTYLPLIGIFVIIAWGIAEIGSTVPGARKAMVVGAAALPVACALLTFIQVGYWRDNVTLFTHTLAVTTGNYMGELFLGNSLLQQERAREALVHYQESLRIRPGYEEVHQMMGMAYDHLGMTDQAIGQYREAVRIKPDLAMAHYYLGVDLDNKGDGEEALRHLEQAVRLNPVFAEGHYDLGIALEGAGRLDRAIEEYSAALKIRPDYAQCHAYLGSALVKAGRTAEARLHLSLALSLKPDLQSARQAMQLLARDGVVGGN